MSKNKAEKSFQPRMVTSVGHLEPTVYRLPVQGDSVLSVRLGVVAELHWLRCHPDCFASCAIVERTNLLERLE